MTTTKTAKPVPTQAPPSLPRQDFQAERDARAAEQDTALTEPQYRDVLEAIATRSHTLNTLLIQLQQRGAISNWADAAVLDAAQQLTEVLGGMADDALGGEVHGDMRNWLYGPNFAQPR